MVFPIPWRRRCGIRIVKRREISRTGDLIGTIQIIGPQFREPLIQGCHEIQEHLTHQLADHPSIFGEIFRGVMVMNKCDALVQMGPDPGQQVAEFLGFTGCHIRA